MLDRAYPKLFGDFHVARVHEAAQLTAVDAQEVEHVVHVEVDCVAQIERLQRAHFFVLDQRLKHLEHFQIKKNLKNIIKIETRIL